MRSWSILTAVLVLGLTAACGKDETPACSTDSDCEVGETCQADSCQPMTAMGECNGDPDCPGGFACVANMCERIALDMGPSNNGMDMSTPNNSGNDMNFDNIPPRVVSTTPAEQALDVPVDSSVTGVPPRAIRGIPTTVREDGMTTCACSGSFVVR